AARARQATDRSPLHLGGSVEEHRGRTWEPRGERVGGIRAGDSGRSRPVEARPRSRALHHRRPPPSPRGAGKPTEHVVQHPVQAVLRRAPHSTRIQRGRCGRENADGLDSTAVKIYTRAGDDGTTGTLGKGRVAKSDPRIEAYGTIDELNAAL